MCDFCCTFARLFVGLIINRPQTAAKKRTAIRSQPSAISRQKSEKNLNAEH